LAAEWGLAGPVHEEHVARLADGRHPLTDEQLVRHRLPAGVIAEGQSTTAEHRAGWDATFSAPKSVSITALVGGDERVIEAHRASVDVALDEIERYVQARIGGNRLPETTGKWIAARFEHDSARPVDGYAAPQLHTHVVIFNLTERADGEPRALQPRELYRSQQYATAIYRSELAARLQELGYVIERGSNGQPEIRGYSAAYLEASSPRRQEIKAQLEQDHQTGAEAARVAAHRTRAPKLDVPSSDMRRRHQELARVHGDQAREVTRAARQRGQVHWQPDARALAAISMTYATGRNFERETVVDERAILRDALARGLGDVRLPDVQRELDRRTATAQLLVRAQSPHRPSRSFTTSEMLALERETIETMLQGRAMHSSLAARQPDEIATAYPHLTADQRAVLIQVLSNADRVQALEGVAGAGKTTTLTAVREELERDGYRVQGLAPTSRAAAKLAESGIASMTLQRHLMDSSQPLSSGQAERDQPHIYVLDESSLASTRQMHEFLQRLGPTDRVLLVGDVRQHHAVEAGRPYQQLQEAGLATARLDTIVRQQDPQLKEAVEHLSRGRIQTAVAALTAQHRIQELPDREARLAAIAREFMKEPANTLVVSPDNASRQDLNRAIHALMQRSGQVAQDDHHLRVLVPRQDVTGADRQWAARYAPGDVVRYPGPSTALRIRPGEYARVVHVDSGRNQVTVSRADGDLLTYSPRRLSGIALYREEQRAFAVGDRVQFTAPYRVHRVANRELGTIDAIDDKQNVTVRLDSGRTIRFNIAANPHLDHGYAVTSHSSQGQTADRVLVHVDTQLSEELVNRRFAYVALSRSRHDAQVFTNDATQLARALDRDPLRPTALEHVSAQSIGSNVAPFANARLEPSANSQQERARSPAMETTVSNSQGLSRE
jgi:conjugative relaxase-like TrwC/TraI family protein